MSKRERERAQAAADLQHAGRLLESEDYPAALPLLRRAAQVLQSEAVRGALADCLWALGRRDEALTELEGLARSGLTDPQVAFRVGGRLAELGRFAEALPLLLKAQPRFRANPGYHAVVAYAALQSGDWAQAESQARAATEALPGSAPEREDAALFLALALAAQGRYAEAAGALSAVARQAGLAARFHLLGGDLARANALYAELESAGTLAGPELALASQAAALGGDPERARTLLARAEREAPGPATRLAQAQVALLGGRPEEALPALAALAADADADPADRALASALRARALRQRDRAEEARAALAPVGPDAPPRVRLLAEQERGHLAAQAGEFEQAEAHFAAALALDPKADEAQRGLELARKRLAWRGEVLAGAEQQVEAARAEAEALRRSFLTRERELESLRREIAQLEQKRKELERARADAEAEAVEAKSRAEAERQAAVQRELAEREAEVAHKTSEELRLAFSGRPDQAPKPVLDLLRVAEQSYQVGLLNDLPGAGVAVLYTGALERALYVCIVSELDRHLDQAGRRAALLSASLKGGRPGKPEYQDHFVAAFDREHPGRAPGLGEVARVLKRRGDGHLAIVRAFLEEERGWPPAFLDALAAFLDEIKVRLRDPVAHGQVLDVPTREVAELRRSLMREFQGGPGVLERLAFPRG